MSKEKILEAAYECFSRGCYNCTSLSEIAERVGIKKPSIYAHFANKEKLFLEVLDIELDRLYSYINMLINDNKFQYADIKLYKFLVGSIDYIVKNKSAGGFWRNLLFTPPTDLHKEICLRITDFKNYIRNLILQIIKQGVDKGEIIIQDEDGLIYSYMCLLQGNLVMLLDSNLFSMDKVNTSWQLFLEGIRKR